MKLKRCLLFIISFLAFIYLTSNLPVIAVDIDNGAKIFENYCAGCHPNGGNIIRRGKTLKQKALKKYKLDSKDAIINLVNNGKNNMSAFKDRLQKQEIENVAVYILERARENWKK